MTNIGQNVTKTVKEIILNDIFLQASIRGQYCNYSAIARKIKPLVDKKVGYDADIQSIVTALKRLKPSLTFSPKNVKMVLADSNLSVKTGVAKITVEKTRTTTIKFSELIRKYINSIIHVSIGSTAITIIMDEMYIEDVLELFEKPSILENKRNLAAIIVTSTPEITDVPGCAISIYERLFSAGINIEDTTSSYTDTVIILKNEDVGKAFETLNELINETKREIRSLFKKNNL
ncbi:MAG: ACT domain-containing protein [Nitrososphaeria archaeon]|nr:ACT domain-containing protein [Nitrososphaeria archaeon]